MKLIEIHKILLQEKLSRVEENVEQIEKYKDDPRRMFQVIKEMQREKPKNLYSSKQNLENSLQIPRTNAKS